MKTHFFKRRRCYHFAGLTKKDQDQKVYKITQSLNPISPKLVLRTTCFHVRFALGFLLWQKMKPELDLWASLASGSQGQGLSPAPDSLCFVPRKTIFALTHSFSLQIYKWVPEIQYCYNLTKMGSR